jgi:hypothetical protein
LSLRQLEWLAILAPIVFLGVVYFLVLGPVPPHPGRVPDLRSRAV